ncbi:peptidase C10 [Desulfovibrio sulfodismutans]|uniref:Peptidase C10 n=1 Tax=Desulfolutivibrio sulfodismutans TaxID=63561 RepID=A0A7K3NP94_9BACT|nr:C10 family peptidase [Desulfolutivibrio sulfodismutans]NDY57990.1 peptidase C10 [Desulfolutivibrio sulfodismutans]
MMKWRREAVCVFVAMCLFPTLLLASPTTPEQARQMVTGWLTLDHSPLRTDMGKTAMSVSRYDGADGQAAYYIVYTNPKGFVIVPADDEVEPIIGFSPDGAYDPSPKNPLGALVSQDVPGRVAFVRQEATKNQEASTSGATAQGKWARFLGAATTEGAAKGGVPTISDVWVEPLLESTWSQSTAGGVNTYNIYTPNNYVCGCVATAMAQLMRFHQHPATGVGTDSYTIYIDSVETTRALRGGDGSGGDYSWSDMVLSPDASTTTAQRQAIGALTADAGVSVNMDYTSGSSGTDTLKAANALRNTFSYSNAMAGYNSGSNLPTTNRNAMSNPNLDAGYPVLFGITGDGGHAIVGDGYGYDSSTLYHHLNMGWAGSDDLWYNLPTIDTTYYNFNSVYKCIYNVYVTGTGEIISGRVTNASGTPIAGATVTATRTGGGTYTGTTDAKGIYALSKVPSASTYTINVAKAGYTFTSQQATTATSTNYSITTGNVWGVDFTGTSSGSGDNAGSNLLLLSE